MDRTHRECACKGPFPYTQFAIPEYNLEMLTKVVMKVFIRVTWYYFICLLKVDICCKNYENWIKIKKVVAVESISILRKVATASQNLSTWKQPLSGTAPSYI